MAESTNESAKLRDGMSNDEILEIMSEGDPRVVNVLTREMGLRPGFCSESIRVADRLGIRGADLYELWDYCCKRDRTLLWVSLYAASTEYYYMTPGLLRGIIVSAKIGYPRFNELNTIHHRMRNQNWREYSAMVRLYTDGTVPDWL